MSTTIVTEIIRNTRLTPEVFLLELPFAERPLPGQFVMLSFADTRTDPLLPRPISIFDWDSGVLRLLIRIAGRGTALMAEMQPGEKLRITGPVGNSFPDTHGRVVFMGGGIGIAPLYYAAKCSKAAEKHFILGFRTAAQSYLTGEFARQGTVHLVSDDGTIGEKGYPHEVLTALIEKTKVDMVLTCGPEKMMEAIHRTVEKKGVTCYHSLESRMGCGIGACLGCRVAMPGRSVLVCKEGPIFEDSDIFTEKK